MARRKKITSGDTAEDKPAATVEAAVLPPPPPPPVPRPPPAAVPAQKVAESHKRILFTKPWQNYNSGEIAGFARHTAMRIVKFKAGVVVNQHGEPEEPE